MRGLASISRIDRRRSGRSFALAFVSCLRWRLMRNRNSLGFLLSGASSSEQSARIRELRVLAFVYCGPDMGEVL
jgi:hypothetical protein